SISPHGPPPTIITAHASGNISSSPFMVSFPDHMFSADPATPSNRNGWQTLPVSAVADTGSRREP
ncbi:MAG: hypothetical protein WD609_15345, partial [Aquisalimonadaceae bacterium]